MALWYPADQNGNFKFPLNLEELSDSHLHRLHNITKSRLKKANEPDVYFSYKSSTIRKRRHDVNSVERELLRRQQIVKKVDSIANKFETAMADLAKQVKEALKELELENL